MTYPQPPAPRDTNRATRITLTTVASIVMGIWTILMTVGMVLLIWGEAAILASFVELKGWLG
jgi:hypothetical protein